MNTPASDGAPAGSGGDDVAARAGDGVAALAAALLSRASALLPSIPVAGRAGPLAAIDAFIAAPGAARFLAASRSLVEARRLGRLAELQSGFAERSFARSLERLRVTTPIDPSLVVELARLPVDERAGRRLAILAALVESHAALADRVAGHLDVLREKLAAARASDRADRKGSGRRR